jgi:hypothetical protein
LESGATGSDHKILVDPRLRFLNTSENNALRLNPSSSSVLARLERLSPIDRRTPALRVRGARRPGDETPIPSEAERTWLQAQQKRAPSGFWLPHFAQNYGVLSR